MQVQVDETGLMGRAVNPYEKPTEKDYYTRKSEGVSWGDYLHKQWSDFDKSNPLLPLTTKQTPHAVIECKEVEVFISWAYEYRKAYQPL